MINIVQTNPMLTAGLSMYGIGLLTYICKDVPLTILRFVQKQITTTLTLNSHDEVFYDFLKWTENKTFIGLVRNWNFNNGKSSNYYIKKSPMMTIGYGTTYAFWSKKILFIDRHKIESSQTTESKETITVTAFGRKNVIFTKIFKEIEDSKKIDEDFNLTDIRIYKNDHWQTSCKVAKKSLDSVVIDNDSKEAILNHIKNFLNNKAWYELHGIPYRTGILLEGPPGTGKTSLVKAIAGHLNRPLHYIDATECGPSVIKNALLDVKEDSLLVIEEIDRIFTMPRMLSEEDDSTTKTSGNQLLNCLDGIVGSENRIIIATTNHMEKLDPALIREGRFDLKVHIGYMTDRSFKEYASRMYPDFKEFDKYRIKENIAPCLVQKLVFDDKNDPKNMLNKIAHEVLNQ